MLYGDILAVEKVSVTMTKGAHEKLKEYCDDNGRIMYKVIDEAILNYVGENDLSKINKKMMGL